MLAGVAACATPTVATVEGACGVFRPLTYSKADTTPTQREIVGHNAAGRAACGPRWGAR